MLPLVLMSIKVAGFFNHQYVWRSSKGKQSVLDFLVKDRNQAKVACKTTTSAWVWLRKLSQRQKSLDLPWVGFGRSGDGMATLEVIQNERLTED